MAFFIELEQKALQRVWKYKRSQRAKVFMINKNWEDPEGSGRERGGRGDQDGEYM